MRADEPIGIHELNRMGTRKTARYINQLRVDRLMAKAGFFAELKHNGDYLLTMANDNKSWEELELQLMCISRTYEAKAKKIKEGM